MISVSSFVSLLGFCSVDLPIGESGVLTLSTIGVWNLMCDLSFGNVSFIYVTDPVFGA